jgi:DNA-binding transcriptional LysR family regulator
MSALTHDFIGKALEVWRETSPGIVIDCIEMDALTQERALIEGRIAVGILVPSDRPVLELLRVRLLVKYQASLALPKSHPHADKPQIPLSLLKDEAFIGLNRMHPNYDDWLLKNCRRAGFKPRIVKEADGAASALAFVSAGFGVAVISEPLRQIPAKDVIFRDLAPEDKAWVPVGAAWKPEALTAPVASQFIDVLAQTCAGGNGGSRVLREQYSSREADAGNPIPIAEPGVWRHRFHRCSGE